MICRKIYFKQILLLALMAYLALPGPLAAAVSVNGNLEAKNQSGVHEGDIYRNYLKADLELGENLNNTVVKVLLRAEDDSLKPEDEDGNYLRDDNTGPQRIYLREGYISHDIQFESIIDSISLKMGRIIYTWGNSDEEKPVDIINPQDYSNLYFTPIQERKIGVFSGSMSVFFTENFFIEGVVIPESRPSEIASTIFVTREVRELKENQLFILKDPVSPDSKNSENNYAGRIGFTLFDIDMHASYYRGYDHIPVNEMALNLTNPLDPKVDATPVYKKIQMFGFDFQRALLWGITLRGEGAYYNRGKYFYYDSESATGNQIQSPFGQDILSGGEGTAEKDYSQYTAGFDDHDFIFDDLYLNLQFSQKMIIGYDDKFAQDRFVNHILWNVKYFMGNRKYCLSSMGAYNIKDKSCYANAEFLVKFADNFDFMAGGWLLEGDEDTEIGQFDHYDLVYIAGKLTF